MNKLKIKLYLFNLALLVTHEIDSSYWKEWKLFGIPGGIQVFLVVNFILILFFLIGSELVANSKKSAIIYSYIGFGRNCHILHSLVLYHRRKYGIPFAGFNYSPIINFNDINSSAIFSS